MRGSAVGTAIEAYATLTGDLDIDWDVYSGLEFVEDQTPNPSHWIHRDLDERALASALAHGRVAAWVQGRWEIGPRALGNRSLLAEPTSPVAGGTPRIGCVPHGGYWSDQSGGGTT
jgi:hydroxymethyl cephem carbamoyltransferase